MHAKPLLRLGVVLFAINLVAPAHARDQAAGTFDSLHAAYVGGDFGVLARVLQTPHDLQHVRPQYELARSLWKSRATWTRANVAFAIDLAAVAMTRLGEQTSAL